MAQLEIRWSKNSVRQINRIAEYIGEDSPVQAKRVVELIFSAPERVSENPRIGQIVPEFGLDQIREVRVYSYRIIYRFTDTNLEIAGVLHGRQLLTEDRISGG